MLASDTILQNRYQIIRQLGAGGMGTVYEALDKRLSCIVALKQTLGSTDEARKSFEREAALLANLRHRALPKVIDYFSEDNYDFLVMEFIPGDDLEKLLKIHGEAFPVTTVLRWADEILTVLEYLHGCQPPILHRDIKPSNLKLTKEDEIFLLDFGLAKGAAGQMSTLLTNRSVRGYTPVYASLEQIHGKGTDPRSDLYSMGATLYHLLAGRPPTDAPTRFDALEDEKPDPLRRLDELNSNVPSTVASIIHQAMAVSRKQRPASASEMRKALREAEEDERRRAEEKEQLRRDAERRRREEEEKRQRLAAEEEARRLEAKRLREKEKVKSNQAELPQTIPAIAPSTVKSQGAAAQSNIKTWKAPPPERLYVGAQDATLPSAQSEDGKTVQAVTFERKRVWMRAVLVVIATIVIGTVALVWLAWEGNKQSSDAGASTNTEKPANPTSTVAQSPAKPETPNADTVVRNQLGMEFAYVPAGSFMMGSRNGAADEKPVHQVTISTGFYLGRYEVTQAQWQAVMGTNPSSHKGDNLPVENVSWNDAQKFIQQLNARGDGFVYRLPSEAEWEYACRAGTKGDYAGKLDEVAWHLLNSGRKPHPVGQKQPNAWGLYDMHGNVWEWCEDLYHENYKGAPVDGSAWLSEVVLSEGRRGFRVTRGGSWHSDPVLNTSSVRYTFTPSFYYFDYGFRVAASRRQS